MRVTTKFADRTIDVSGGPEIVELFLAVQRLVLEEKWLAQAGELEGIELELRNVSVDAHEGAVRQANTCDLLQKQNRLEPQVAEVYEALERLESGTYGLCAHCGGEIGVDRLEARPETRYCVGCMPSVDRRRK